MRSRVNCLVGVWLSLLVLMSSVAMAERADVRLVNAVAEQDTQAALALLDEGVDVDAARPDGVTALLWAAHWDDVEMATLILRAGADANATDDHGVTPLERACENASLAMAEVLLAGGADPNVARTSGLTPLMTAARTGSLEVVRTLLAAGADANTVTDETRSTALMWAISEAHPDVVGELLRAGTDPHASTAKGFTPLLYAVHNGDIEMIETLIAAGVDINESGEDGTHALPYAIVSGQDHVAVFLLEVGADPNGTMGGVAALHAAVGNVGTWLAKWYRRHGRGSRYTGNPFAVGFRRDGLSPGRRLPLVKALLEHGADPNAKITSWAMLMSYIGYPKKGAFEPFSCGTGNLQGATPLWVAAYSANSPLGDIRGGRSDIFDPDQTRASTEIITALLAGGAQLHLTTDDGTTPLMVAAGLGRSTYTPREPRGVRSPSAEEAVRVLLEAGADINAVNEADFTALHGAAFRGLNEVIEYLVAQGADIDARDFRGRTPYRMAEGSKQSFQFQSWPDTAALIAKLGAATRLGIPGTVQERVRDIATTDNQLN